eukprot:superscaffoldBa00000085_g1263
MGNVESQNGVSGFNGDVTGHLSRKHTSRSLRLSNKQPITRRSRTSSSVKQEHRNSEASTRSSSTPSIPQSLAENGLEPFNATDAFGDFGISPHWTQRVAMTMRPESYQHDDDLLATPTPETSEADTVAHDGGEDSMGEGDGDVVGEERYLQRMTEGPQEGGSFKKKRSKSADMWREDSLEFSLSDLSQEHLTSTEEMIDGGEEEEEEQFTLPRGTAGSAERASSLDHLCSQQSPGLRGQRSRYTKNRREAECDGDGEGEEGLMSPEEDSGGYGAFTLPCRRSHCLSEGLAGLGITAAPCPAFQGRRAQTTQDISGVLGEGSEYGDSGIDGVTTEIDGDGELVSRRCKAMSASFSVYSATESSTHQGRDCTEEAGSAVSDEQSSGTLSSAYPSDALMGCAQGTVRKAGALAVKNFLVHKKNKKVEPATRRKWKHYWVSLKGCTLFLYESDGRSGIDHNSVPKHALWVENSIVQAVPEHPKKDFVFCLSNSVGDAFLFQTSGQTELENWITAIHSACAAALARQHHREDTVRLLRTEIRKLEQKIDMDEKMKKMGDMQLSTVTDAKKRKTILEQVWSNRLKLITKSSLLHAVIRLKCSQEVLATTDVFKYSDWCSFMNACKCSIMQNIHNTCRNTRSAYTSRQIFLWEQNLERFHMDLFRCRCYLASLQGGEPPNPKRLLGFASRPTKLAMGRLGIFSVSSFHALKEREGSVKSLPQQNVDSDIWVPDYLTPSWVCLPNNQPVLAIIQPAETVLEVLSTVCKSVDSSIQFRVTGKQHGLLDANYQRLRGFLLECESKYGSENTCDTHKIDPSGHYLRLKVWVDNQMLFYVPKLEEDISDLLYKEIEISPKATKVIRFDKAESCSIGYGFSVEVIDEDGTQQLHITEVKAGGLASAKGLKVGDEILLLNGKPASALQMDDMRAAFVNQALTLSVSTLPQLDSMVLCSNPPRRSDGEQDLATDIFSQSQEDILDEVSGLTVESLDESLAEGPRLTLQSPGDHQEDKTCTGAEQKSTEQVTAFCRSLHDMNPLECPMSSSSSSSSSSLSPSPVSALPPTAGAATQRQLSHADKLRKVINELVETEKTYVKLDVLFGNLGEMVEFQVEFLRTLEDGIRLVPDLDRLERVEQFKKVLFSLGGSFLYYADRFKIYSAFCASHTKVPKVLTKAKTDPDFKAFLAERNPRQQHSSTLESYLIKPIQRVLKYPLLLKELYSLTDPDSEEHYHLDVAMKAMNKVASHINEMQKLHEEYGAVFDQLINEQTADKKEVADLSMGDLLLHSTVMWINPPASLVKSKKDPDLAAFALYVFDMQPLFQGGSHRASVSDDKDPFRFRHMIATDSLQVRALANSEGTAVCEIVHTKSESEGRPERTFQLCCSSPDSKKDFLKAVHSILREKQRRQLLKTESLPPNQQYVPFGGKRLCALKGSRPTMNRAASAPSRSLARRKLVRNRFTIDTDLVFHGNNNNSNDSDPSRHSSYPSSYSSLSNHGLLQSHKPQGEDTDRWVEEQFDLGRYEDQGEGIDVGQVKETDILSDDDEYCKSVRAASSEPVDLEGKMDGLNLQAREARSHDLNGRVETGSEVIQGVMREDEVDRMKRGDDSGSVDSYTSCGVPLSRCATPTLKLAPLKQCAVEGAANKDHDVIWVRRDDFTNGCNSDVF